MTALDIILLLVFIGSAWLGFRKGIIKQLGSLAAIVIAIIAKLLCMVSHAVFLGPLDRIAGAAFSVAKYFLLVSLLLNLYMVIFPDTPLRTKSNLCGGRVVTLTARFAPWVLDAVSPLGTDDDQNLKTEQTDKAPVPTRTNV